MLNKFVLKKEALEKLEKTGLRSRIENAVKGHLDIYGYRGIIYEDEIPILRDEMKEKGIFAGCDTEKLSSYKNSINKFVKDFKNGRTIEEVIKGQKSKIKEGKILSTDDLEIVTIKPHWIVNRPEGPARRYASLEDFIVFSGYLASHILTPEEFWDHEKFGFESVSDFHGAIAAYLQEFDDSYHGYRKGYTQESEDHKHIQVTADMHGDLRIYRTDRTPYGSIDPLGNNISYRPIVDEDEEQVIAYHSTEAPLLAAIVKYVAQEGIDSELLKDGAKEFLEEVSGWSEYRGNFAEAFGSSGNHREHYWHLDIPIPQLDDKGVVGWTSTYVVHTEYGSAYGLYVAPDNSLVFAYEDNSEQMGRYIRKVVPALVVPPDEIDYLIRGLFVQTSKGLGRTHLNELVDGLGYYFSEGKLKEDLKWLNEGRSGGEVVKKLEKLNEEVKNGYLFKEANDGTVYTTFQKS